jgi:EAL domain-containing protein (putative c-di-GMP-specific phosphodiesterase class I)
MSAWGKLYHEFIRTLSSMLEGNRSACLLCISIDNLPMILPLQQDGSSILSGVLSYLEKTVDSFLYGGQIDQDKLFILIQNNSASDTENHVKMVRDLIASYGKTVTEMPLQLASTIGAVSLPEVTSTAQDAIQKAFVALSDAKDLSRPYALYQDEKRHIIESKNQMILATYLQNALQHNKLRLAYQPITHSQTGEVHYYECLLRIVGPNHSTTSAGPFIPVAERLGFIDVIDAFVLKMAVDDLQKNPDIRLAINLSNTSIHSHHWQDMALDLLQDKSIASRMVIEMTETSEQHDLKSAAHFIENLKGCGCQIALDDFGSGYTSFTQLQVLPVDTIKIDGSFVRNIAENKENRFFVKTLKAFSDNFGLKTVAEFVESKEIADILRDMGIDYLQGNYLSPAVDYRPWL